MNFLRGNHNNNSGREPEYDDSPRYNPNNHSAQHHHSVNEKHGVKHTVKPVNTGKGGLDYNKTPTFGQWLKTSWVDILTLAAIGALALGVIDRRPHLIHTYSHLFQLYYVRPTKLRDFPIVFQDGEIVYPQYAYPNRKYSLPLWGTVLISILGPIAIMLIMQYKIRSFWDLNNAVFGLLYSVVTAALFQVIMKWLIGGLAPNFLEVCKPSIPSAPILGTGFRQIMYNSGVCTGNPYEIAVALESFPCGQSTTAFAGLIFLFLYINAKTKVWANYHPKMWKLLLVYLPVLGAVLISGQLSISRHHNWYDCIVGALIGTVFAFSAYRMVYASIWDFRFNHIPLNRKSSLDYGSSNMELFNACFTREAGWKFGDGVWGGAPFDSAMGHKKPAIVSSPIARAEPFSEHATPHSVNRSTPVYPRVATVEESRPSTPPQNRA